jgi:ribosomal protein S18 acetylase RimI-like enzyme
VKTIRYFSASIKGVCRGELPKVDLSVYPAHLHINVDAGWRGHGLGRRLMEAYLDHLRQLGIQGVYLETTSVNIVARELYERIGFTLLDSRATRVWEHMIDQPIYNLCYGLKLT